MHRRKMSVLCFAVYGALVAFIGGLMLLGGTFSSPDVIPGGVWALFLLVMILSAIAAATTVFCLNTRLELWSLRDYVDTFFSAIDHQAGVTRVLNNLALEANSASKNAINLRTNGVRLSDERIQGTDPDEVLAYCREIQEELDTTFRRRQNVFYWTFDLAVKFKDVFHYVLAERKFKAYLPSELDQRDLSRNN